MPRSWDNPSLRPQAEQAQAAAMLDDGAAINRPDRVLSGEIQDLRAHVNREKVTVTWKSVDETGILRFMVERTIDGNAFTPIGSIAASGSPEIARSYAMIDASPINGNVFYCLYAMDDSGRKKCMGTVESQLDASPSIKLFSNPGSQAQAIVEVNYLSGEMVDWQLIDMQGNLALSAENEQVKDGHLMLHLIDYKALKSGIYILCIQDQTTAFTHKMVLQN